MMLADYQEAELVYVLVDTPEHQILDAMRRKEWQRGDIELPEDIADKIRHDMTFGDIDENVRVKRYVVNRDDKMIARIKECVEMAREYLAELDLMLNPNK